MELERVELGRVELGRVWRVWDMEREQGIPPPPCEVTRSQMWGVAGSMLGVMGCSVGVVVWSLATGRFIGAMGPIVVFVGVSVAMACLLGSWLLMAARLGYHRRISRWMLLVYGWALAALGVLLAVYVGLVQPALGAQGSLPDRVQVRPMLAWWAVGIGAAGGVLTLVVTWRQR